MDITLLIIAIALATFVLARRFYRNRRAPVSIPKPRIIAVERNGVVAAYRLEDLPPSKTNMLAPVPGLMVFSDAPIPGPTTGTLSDLTHLAETSGRPLVWESSYALYVPYTGGFYSEIDRDVADYGHFVVPPNQALSRLTQ